MRIRGARVTAALIALATGHAASAPEQPPTIVIGFVGGFVRHDNPIHAEVQIAEHLRRDYGAASVHAAVFENRPREDAHRGVLRGGATHCEGGMGWGEKGNARGSVSGIAG